MSTSTTWWSKASTPVSKMPRTLNFRGRMSSRPFTRYTVIVSPVAISRRRAR